MVVGVVFAQDGEVTGDLSAVPDFSGLPADVLSEQAVAAVRLLVVFEPDGAAPHVGQDGHAGAEDLVELRVPQVVAGVVPLASLRHLGWLPARPRPRRRRGGGGGSSWRGRVVGRVPEDGERSIARFLRDGGERRKVALLRRGRGRLLCGGRLGSGVEVRVHVARRCGATQSSAAPRRRAPYPGVSQSQSRERAVPLARRTRSRLRGSTKSLSRSRSRTSDEPFRGRQTNLVKEH